MLINVQHSSQARFRCVFAEWKEKGKCSKGDQCSFRHESNDRAPKPTPKTATPSEPSMTRGRSASRKRSVRGRSQTGRILRDAKQGTRVCSGTLRLQNNHVKKPKKSFNPQNGNSDDKGAAAAARTVPQLGCVSQDSEPPEPPEKRDLSGRNPRQKVLGSIRQARFTQSTLRQASIRENKGPSLGNMQVKIPHQRSLYAIMSEDRSPGETARQERCALGDVWKLAKIKYTLKKEDKATFYSHTSEWIMPATSTIKRGEREFVVDSGVSMHMVIKKDLNRAELENVRISKNPTTVMTANPRGARKRRGNGARPRNRDTDAS